MRRSLVALLLLLACARAHAQSGRIDVELFRPNADGHGIFATESGGSHAPWQWSAGLWSHYAQRQLTFGPDAARAATIDLRSVNERVTFNFVATLAFTKWLQVGMTMPFALMNDVFSVAKGETNVSGLGTIWFSPKFHFLRQRQHGVDMSFIPAFGIPSGSQTAFLGQEGFQFQPTLAVERGFGAFRALLNIGGTVREGVPYFSRTVGNDLIARVGLGLKVHDRVELGAEFLSAIRFSGDAGHPMELLLGAQVHLGKRLHVFVGAGPGFNEAIGTPSVRVFAGLGFISSTRDPDTDGDGVLDSVDRCPLVKGPKENQGCPVEKKPEPKPQPKPEPKVVDTDGDGLPDSEDKCPKEPGPRENGGCPWPDRDKDGVPDKEDECPNVPGPKENKGCPVLDRDKDGIPDKADRCPDEPGPIENQGCPPDRDKDGVPDNKDRCPDVPGVKDNQGCPWPDRDGDGLNDKEDDCPDQPGPVDNKGCPRKGVVVTRGEVRITEQVRFRTNKATILRPSFKILNQVADVLKQFPAIKKVEVQGHTDDVGRARKNMALSKRRADAVRNYLIKKGVAGDRLVAKGYGSTVPLVPIEGEMTKREMKAARDQNRRVQFIILEKAKN